MSIRSSVRSLSQKTSTKGIVLSVMLNTATVRLSGGGQVLHGLEIVGGNVFVGDVVRVTYSNGIPHVEAGGSSIGGRSTVTVLASGSTTNIISDGIIAENEPTAFDLWTAVGWTLDVDNSIINNDIRLSPSGRIVLGVSPNLVELNSQDSSYRMWVGAEAGADAPFSISPAGAIKAISGSVAGWALGANTFTAEDTNTVISSGTQPYIRIGATGYDSGSGFWVGHDGGSNYDLFVGNSAGNKLLWDGSAGTLSITGTISATLGNIGGWTIESESFYSGNLKLRSGAYPAIMGNATVYRSTTPGFFFGYDTTSYVAFIGDYDTQYLDWDGSALTIQGTIQSSNYASGISGWRIDQNGDAEFNNVFVRGSIIATVFEKALISAHAGSTIVTKSASTITADCVVPSSGTWTLTVKKQADAAPFSSGDIIRIKDGTGDTWMTVDTGSGSGDNWIYTATYQSGTRPYTYKEGYAAIDYGASGDGGVLITADWTNSPFLSIFTHAGAPWTTITERARLGNLNGITGASGYGLSSDNCFLEGVLVAGNGSVVLDEDGLHITHADTAISMEDNGQRYSRIFHSVSSISTGPWDIILETGKPTGNLVINGGFESGSTGWTLVNATVATDAKRTGTYGLNMFYTSPGSASAQSSSFVAVTAGEQYSLEAYFRIAWGEMVAPSIIFSVMWYTSGDSYLSASSVARTIQLYQCAPGGGPHDWERITSTFLAPFTAAKMKIKVELNYGSAIGFVDDISLSSLIYGTVFKVSSSSTDRSASIVGHLDILNFPSTSNKLRFFDNNNNVGFMQAHQVDTVVEGEITIQSGYVSASQSSLELNASGDSVVTTVLLQSSPQKVSVYGDLSVLIPGDTGDITATGNIIANGYLKASGDGGSYGVFIGSDCQIYRSAANVLYSPDSISTGVNLAAAVDVLAGAGLCVGNTSFDPQEDTILIANKSSNPTLHTGGVQLYTRNNSLLLTDQGGDQYNLNGAGYGGFLVNNYMRNPYASWTLYPTQWGAVDHGPGQFHLTPNGGSWLYEVKPDPGYMYCPAFDGSSNYLSYALSAGSPPNGIQIGNWFSFGIWVKFDDFDANHGIACMGSTSSSAMSWWINWWSNNIEFGYIESGTLTARAIYSSWTTASEWVFIGACLGHNGGSGFDMMLKVNDTEVIVDENDYDTWTVAPQAGTGDFMIGYSARGWVRLDGYAATAFLGGNGQELVRKYYEHTRGYFNI